MRPSGPWTIAVAQAFYGLSTATVELHRDRAIRQYCYYSTPLPTSITHARENDQRAADDPAVTVRKLPRATITKAPSAELRPDQKDEDSLPPYDVLDRILKAYIEDLKSPDEIADHYGFDLKLVRHIALQVDRNEYKRKQAAPGLKITSRAFGFGRPFPIAQNFIP